MAAQWHSSAYSHGYLILPASLYVIWKRREKMAVVVPTSDSRAILLLIVAMFGWLLGNLTTTAVVEQFSVVLFIIGLVWEVLGSAVVRVLLFPLVFLIFAVPMGESFIPVLQDFSARFAVKLLYLSGVPVLLEGHYITVPHGTWEVAEVCSGVRYLTASLAVGFLFAGLIYRSWVRRIGFFLASAVIPILANGVRIYGIVLMGYLVGNRLALNVDHILAGLVFLTIVMMLLFAIGLRWREDGSQEMLQTGGKTKPFPTRSGTGATVENPYFTARTTAALASSLLVILLGPISAKYFWNNQSAPREVHPAGPAVSAPWIASQTDDFVWEARFQSPTAELRQTYESANRKVRIYLAYYSGEEAGGKLVSSANQLYDRPHWLRMGEGRMAATINGQTIPMHEVLVQSRDSALVIWHCYWVDGEFTSSDYWAKLLQAKARMFGSRQSSIAVVLATENLPPESRGAEVLRDFLRHAVWQTDLPSAQKTFP